MLSDLDQELCDSVWEGDAERVRELCVLGANIECYNDMGNTPLHLAVEQCDLEITKILLEHGADVDRRTELGSWTPLVHAVEALSDAAHQINRPPDNRILEVLLQHGADVNARDFRGWSALFFAEKHGNIEAQRILRAAGARR